MNENNIGKFVFVEAKIDVEDGDKRVHQNGEYIIVGETPNSFQCVKALRGYSGYSVQTFYKVHYNFQNMTWDRDALNTYIEEQQDWITDSLAIKADGGRAGFSDDVYSTAQMYLDKLRKNIPAENPEHGENMGGSAWLSTCLGEVAISPLASEYLRIIEQQAETINRQYIIIERLLSQNITQKAD